MPADAELSGLKLLVAVRSLLDQGMSEDEALREVLARGATRDEAKGAVDQLLASRVRAGLKDVVKRSLAEGASAGDVADSIRQAGGDGSEAARLTQEICKERQIEQGWRLARRLNRWAIALFLVGVPAFVLGALLIRRHVPDVLPGDPFTRWALIAVGGTLATASGACYYRSLSLRGFSDDDGGPLQG